MMKNRWQKSMLWLFSSLVILATSCEPSPTYQAYKDLDNGFWVYDSAAVFQFNISEPTAPYQADLLIRNSLSYKYHNLYVKFELVHPNGQVIEEGMEELQLMHQQTGEPFGEVKQPKGKSAGYYFDHTFPILENLRLQDTGIYTFSIKQYMRTDSLQEIVAVGLVVDKQKLNNAND